MLPRFYDVHSGHDHDRRRRRARRAPRLAARQHRRRVRRLVPVLRHAHRQHRLRPARRDTRGDRDRGARRRGARVHPAACRRATTRSSASRASRSRAASASGSRSHAALLSDPKILLLDDATSSVDSRVEEEIHATLRRIASTRTTILIAHRRSSLSLADRIVVVDHGAVLDAGTHDELWARCSLYRMLLSGPGGDAEGLEAVEAAETAATDGQVDGITPSAWRGLDDEEIRSAQIAERTRTASPTAAVRVMGGGGGGGMGRGGGWGGALAPTPELLAQVDALEPATADPHVDVAFESAESHRLQVLALPPALPRLAARSACCSSRSTRSARSPARCSCGTASTAASRSTRRTRSGPRRSCSSSSRSSTGG